MFVEIVSMEKSGRFLKTNMFWYMQSNLSQVLSFTEKGVHMGGEGVNLIYGKTLPSVSLL